jgi:hypothetical protein
MYEQYANIVKSWFVWHISAFWRGISLQEEAKLQNDLEKQLKLFVSLP